MQLTDEQNKFLKFAKQRKNIIVDACIGSGKTTVIQEFCRNIPVEKWYTIKILYLTYNARLKDDAREKIRYDFVDVHNYNSFARSCLKNKNVAPNEQISTFLNEKPKIKKYDILIIDEYQDIREEHAKLLEYIKSFNSNIQIIAVGDMKQKIYDYTTLDVTNFIQNFLENYKVLEFTKCFRLNKEYASFLGKIWEKEINGLNEFCEIRKMSFNEVVEYLKDKEPKDILCLGKNGGDRVKLLNSLEERRPNKFNKNTVYSKIDEGEEISRVSKKVGIFCTYDSSKGLERNICVITDFTEEYWKLRSEKPNQKYEILRNIFLVAASRGKNEIIFVEKNNESLINLESNFLCKSFENNKFENVNISEMFNFKYSKDIEDVYSYLSIKEIKQKDNSEIKIKTTDGYIDLSPCIGTYQEFMFFKNIDIDDSIQYYLKNFKNIGTLNGNETLEEKILFLTAIETGLNRYINQVKIPFIKEKEKLEIFNRLDTVFNRDEIVEQDCKVSFYSKEGDLLFEANGRLDVLKNDIIYELKFVNALTKIHFLQCAMYMFAMNKKKGILWNIRKNEMYEIKIRNKKNFIDSVIRTISKGRILKYFNSKCNKLLN